MARGARDLADKAADQAQFEAVHAGATVPAPAADGAAAGIGAVAGGAAVSAGRGGLGGLLGSQLGGLPREFWVLWSGTLVNKMGAFVAPFLVLYLTRERGLSAAAAGSVVAVYGVGALISQLSGGVLADRVGRRATLIFALISFAIAISILGVVRSVPLIVVGALLTGLTGELYRPASSALVADVIAPRDRPRAFGLLFWAVNLGFAIATLLAGMLATHSWGLLFGGDAATSLVFAIVIAKGIRETRPERAPGSAPGGGLRDVFDDRLMLAIVGITMLFSCVYMQMFSTLPLAMGEHGLSPAAYGAAIAVNGVAIVLLQPLASGWLSRRPRVPALAASLLIVGIGFGLNTLASTTPQYMAAVIVWTLGEIGHAALATSVIADLAPPQLRGRYMGVYGFSYGASAVIAPIVGTRVLQSYGATTLWLGCAVLGALMSAAMLSLRAPLARRTGEGLPTRAEPTRARPTRA
ncbi:MAG: MFS transporter [Frankia sp.]|nr:MFS transporter [Frankia sp.]